MKSIIFTCAFIASSLIALSQRRLEFKTDFTTWDDVVKEAQADNKLIFIDVYATWCGPCKLMERDVFSNSTVAEYFDEHFISIKVQVDSTAGDAPDTQQRRKLNRQIAINYKVEALPTFLFFSGEGIPLHKEIGVKSINEFLQAARIAVSEKDKQYYTLTARIPNLDRKQVIGLYHASLDVADTMTSNWALKEYKKYLNSGDIGLTGDELDLIQAYDKIEPNSVAIKNIYRHKSALDSVPPFGRASKILENTIKRTIIRPAIKRADSLNRPPDWNYLTNVVTQYFDRQTALLTVLSSEVSYYKAKKKWKNYASAVVANVENLRMQGTLLDGAALNNFAFAVFDYSHNKSELLKALKWMDEVFVSYPDFPPMLDTKAGLLYKLGNRKLALKIQERAVHLTDKNDKLTRQRYDLMKAGLPTWKY